MYTIIIVILISILFLVLIYDSPNKNNENNKNEYIKILYRQAARWSVASQQDQNPIVKVLHANYGTGYLWALKDIANENDFYIATGGNLYDFERSVVKIQDQATKLLVSKCPDVIPKSDKILLDAIYSSN